MSDLVVVEAGTSWTRWLEARAPQPPPIIAVIQQREEAAADFAARVTARVARLALRGPPIGHMTILGADDWSIPTLQARLTILRNARESGLPCGGIDLALQPTSDLRSGGSAPAP